MKIALLTEKYTPDIGGLAISSERLARLLTSAGHEVRVFAPTGSLLPSERRTHPSNGVAVTRFGAHKRTDDTLADWFEIIVDEHRREPFDLLHAYFLTQAGFIATYAGKYLSLPSVVSIRGNDIDRAAFDPSKFSHFMYALQQANAATTNAQVLVNKAKALADREIFLIPNGVDTGHFKPMEKNLVIAESLGLGRSVTLSEAKGLAASRRDSPRHLRPGQVSLPLVAQNDTIPVMGFVGELREKKGLKPLLSAFTRVNKLQPVALLVVGEVRQGEDKRFFDEFMSTNPAARVIVTGYVSPQDLPPYYSLIDVFVHPSLRDGMPNALLEAMACERAIVATPVGGALDVLTDGKNGMLVHVNDADALAEKIMDLLEHPEKRKILGKNARESIVDRFTTEKELEANLSVYRKLGLQSAVVEQRRWRVSRPPNPIGEG